MLKLSPVPAPIVGEILATQLGDAGMFTDVTVVGDELHLADLDESDRAAAQAVVDAHPAKAQAALDAARTERTNETTIRDRAEQALAVNRTFLNRQSPTNAQFAAQVRSLSRQNVGIIRLLLNRFDGTD